jgi:hypothetical protein
VWHCITPSCFVFYAGLFRDQIAIVGADKVAAIVTDNPKVMISARKKLVAMNNHKHILPLRCMMHGFALILTTALGHPWAKQHVSSAQKIVTFMNASHRPLATVRKFAKQYDVRTGLKTSNTTRINSVHIMLGSVLANEVPLKETIKLNVLDLSKESQREVKRLVESDEFWYEVKILCSMLEPLSQVIMVVQSENYTLAEVTRSVHIQTYVHVIDIFCVVFIIATTGCYVTVDSLCHTAVYICRQWMILAPKLSNALEGGSSLFDTIDFKRHLVNAYTVRLKEMNSVLGRLALFLDPRFKDVVLGADADKKEMRLLFEEVRCCVAVMPRCSLYGVAGCLEYCK